MTHIINSSYRFTSRNLENSLYVNTTNCSPIFDVRLEANGGPLGITLAGSEDQQKPILISALLDGGVAQSTRQLRVGDQLLAVNGESVQNTPLSHATKLLQKTIENIVELKISRPFVGNEQSFNGQRPDQPQAIYAQIQRRPRSPSNVTIDTISSGSREGKYRSFQVTLMKDKVYDDYGFSVSDGLYEKGVFINKIRSGGPADLTSVLKSFDRIIQVKKNTTHAQKPIILAKQIFNLVFVLFKSIVYYIYVYIFLYTIIYIHMFRYLRQLFHN